MHLKGLMFNPNEKIENNLYLKKMENALKTRNLLSGNIYKKEYNTKQNRTLMDCLFSAYV